VTSRSRILSLAGVLALASASLLATAPSALAHAQLLGTSPASGATVPTQPSEVIFEFNQSVGGTLGAVRVYDAQGNEVDDLAVGHPDGRQSWMGVGLRPHLPAGTYTATYRVISADTHIVYGGVVFNIGHPGAAPRFTVAGLVGRNRAGEVTNLAFGAIRFLDYVTIALLAGGLLFTLGVWMPALGSAAGGAPEWQQASEAFARRMHRLLLGAVLAGLLVSLLGILLQGASAAGVSLWDSVKGAVIENTMNSRFGRVWAGRVVDWALIGAIIVAARARRHAPAPVLRPVALGADGLALEPGPPRWLVAVLTAAAAYLVLTPALSGHASIQTTAVFLPSDFIHVLAASVWVGGIASLLLALTAATRRLQAGERSRLLLAALRRFSPLALASVIALALTGTVQAYIEVRSLHGLLHSTYGALVLVKTGLLAGLAALGWLNRERVIPALGSLAAAGSSPGGVGVLARRALRGELLLMLCVFAATAALIVYTPPIDASTGPVSINASLGPAVLEMTVEPARAGPNTIHLYLIDARSGVQFTRTKELTLSARLPGKGIGPLPLHPLVAGPGHYIASGAVLSPPGTWTLELTDRVSEFQEYTKTVTVPIR
jgi:copper transport protein